jgi:cytochrome c oxidase subunit 2
VTGKQFNWEFRYPGNDKTLGRKYFKNINESKSNPLGQIWEDPANHDDIYATNESHIVVGKPVKLIINAKDVIHDVGLAHFRMKMDAVPGSPTTMWFTPKYTTRQMKDKYGESFEYEISCDQMCGRGHYGMRGVLIVETQPEWDAYMSKQTPQYVTAHSGGAPAAPVTPATQQGGNGATADTAAKGTTTSR